MVYMKTLSLLAACIVGLFGKQVHRDPSCVLTHKDNNYSSLSKVSTYLVGPAICEQSMVFGKQMQPADMSRFMDRLKCRVTGHVERHVVGKGDQESFYRCENKKFVVSADSLPKEIHERLEALSAKKVVCMNSETITAMRATLEVLFAEKKATPLDPLSKDQREALMAMVMRKHKEATDPVCLFSHPEKDFWSIG